MNGPSDETLDRLAKMLPTMAQGVAAGQIGGQGQTLLRYPRFSCPACLSVWGKPYQRGVPAPKICRGCQKVLKAGGIIMICWDARFLKVTPKAGAALNPRYAGQIVRISNQAMDRLQALSPPPPGPPPPADTAG